MEQIDAQVSDLRYLSQAPVGISSVHNSPAAAGAGGSGGASSHVAPFRDAQGTATSSPGSAHYGDNSAHPNPAAATSGSAATTPAASSVNGSKRKADQSEGGSGKQTRSKRNRYISIACNECKRRKIKCNGQTPCQRCGNLNLDCLYAPNCCSSSFKDSDEYKHVTSQLDRLQDEVNYLHHSMRNLQNDQSRMASTNDRLATGPASTVAPSPAQTSHSVQRSSDSSSNRRPGFRGPTSMAFSLDVANTTINNMGYKGIQEANEDCQPSQPHSENGDILPPGAMSEPLLDFDKEEMIRLCQVHEDEVGIMYPVLDIQTVISHVHNLYAFLDSVRDQQPIQPINDDKTLQVKICMCCALMAEQSGESPTATRLYESMEVVLNRKLMVDVAEVSTLPLLCLLGTYRFLTNDETLAWRVIGQVVRLAMELGIHQTTGLTMIRDEQVRKNALNSFWSAYMLDRRWAFATGLPYTVQDDEIDPKLPMPDEYPYMVAMITYSRLAAKVWRQVSHFESVLARELQQEEIERLDQEILNWYDTVPEEVKVRSWDDQGAASPPPSYNLQRLRVWTYLRRNQIRIWLYTPILHAATSIMAHPVQAQRVVDLAKDTIAYLNNLNNTTNIYRRMQVFYHQFLTSAISVVFLASVHAPVRFSATCREEFYTALELVKDLSEKSTVSKRLWRTIIKLKDVAPKFGLNPDEDPHSTAALGMIGLARGHQDPNSDPRTQFQRPQVPVGHSQPNGQVLDQNGSRIQSEMSRIFEGYVSLNGFQPGQGDEPRMQPRQPEVTAAPANNMYDMDGTVYPHLKEMF